MAYGKIVAAGIGGFITGIGIGFVLARKLMMKQIGHSIEEEVRRQTDIQQKEIFDFYSAHPEYLRRMNEYKEESDSVEKPSRSEKQPLKHVDTTVTDYASIYPVKVVEKEVTNSEEESLEEKITTQYNEVDKYREPEIIPEEEGRDLPRHVNVEELFYYKEDDVLTDDYGNIIEEVEFVIGNTINKIREYPERSIVYVMNYNQTICYQVEVCMDFEESR